MSLLDAAKDLKPGDHIIYQNVALQYEFQSGVVKQVVDSPSPYIALTSTDARSREDEPTVKLEGDHVFYKVPRELLEGKVCASEVQALVAGQNHKLFSPDLIFLGEMYQHQVEEQLEAIVGTYIPLGSMPKLDLVDVSHLCR